jgi:hypothetical protein
VRYTELTAVLPPDGWDSVLSRARGTLYRNTEKIRSAAVAWPAAAPPDGEHVRYYGPKNLETTCRRIDFQRLDRSVQKKLSAEGLTTIAHSSGVGAHAATVRHKRACGGRAEYDR